MKIVIAIDSFKGCLTSLEAASAINAGIEASGTGANVIILPAADGGEGTTQALIDGLGGTYVSLPVTGPLGMPVTARYGILSDGKTAVLEMAQAAGIPLVPADALNPHDATTFGVGEMIRDGIRRGCRTFLCGIGGSASTDGGTGMLTALGAAFLKADGTPIAPGIRELNRITRIRTDAMLPELKNCVFRIACDVKNPLCGESGAVYVFGPQKGVRPEECESLDRKMRHYADLTAEHFSETGPAGHGRPIRSAENRSGHYPPRDLRDLPGAGAAGGLGFAFASYMPHVTLESGVSMIMDAVGLDRALENADLCITGEGQLDAQTAMGKVPAGVACAAKKRGVRVIAFAGSAAQEAPAACRSVGIDALFPVLRHICTLEEAMDPDTAKRNLSQTAEEVFRLIKTFRNH